MAIILTEAITNVLTKSKIFEPLRKWFFEKDGKVLKFIHRILDCPYCCSVWVGLFSTGMLYLYLLDLLPKILTLFFVGLVIHRLSNVLHSIVDRVDSNHRFGQGN
jgi:hypothetical protein